MGHYDSDNELDDDVMSTTTMESEIIFGDNWELAAKKNTLFNVMNVSMLLDMECNNQDLKIIWSFYFPFCISGMHD